MQNISIKRALVFWLVLTLLVGFVPSLAPSMEAAQAPPGAWHNSERQLTFSAGSARPLDKQRTIDAYLNLPLHFIANQGQVDERVGYYVQSSGRSIYFTAEEVVVALDETVLRLRFVGAKATPPLGAEKRAAKVNYLVGNDPARWQTDIPTCGQVVYHDLYPGIDLRYGGQTGALKYTFVARPGADVSHIRLAYGGAAGLRLDEEGNLLILAARSELKDTKPYAYQEIGGRRVEVDVEFVLRGVRTYGFAVQGAYDPRYPLVIDPTLLLYSTYLGGSEDDRGYSIAVDGAGNVYVTGQTSSTNFPTQNAYRGTFGGGSVDAFVTKIDITKSGAASLVYSTYLGGEFEDHGRGIAVDGAGNAYVTGDTRSEDFPTKNAYQDTIYDYPAVGPSWNGGEHAFVTKLNAAGNDLLYSTFLRGKNSWLPGEETGYGIAVYGTGIAYVAGTSLSSDFPVTADAYQGTKAGDNTTWDAFFAKIDTTQSGDASLLYATYLGGSQTERGLGIAVDAAGNAYLTGQTYSSPDFPTRNPYQATPSGDWDGFVTKISAVGDFLFYSTYLGGSNKDWGYSIAVDNAANAYVTGLTRSINFPTTVGAFDTTCGTDGNCNYDGDYYYDAFVTKIDTTKSGDNSLVYSTYLGGEGDECYYSGCAITVDGDGQAHVTGSTYSAYFPTKNPYRGESLWDDAFVTKFNAAGSALVYSTYLGGNGSDGGTDIALDGQGNAYVSGMTTSTKFFDTKNPYQAANAGKADTFVVVLADEPAPKLSIGKSAYPGVVAPGGLLTYTITVTETEGREDATGVQVTDTVPVSTTCCASIGQGGTLVGNEVVWTNQTVPKGSSIGLTFVVTVGQVPNHTTITNDAYRVVTSTQGVTTGLGSAVNTTATVLPISKSAFPDPVKPGEVLHYTIVITALAPITSSSGLAGSWERPGQVSERQTLPYGVQVVDVVPMDTTCCASIGQGGVLFGDTLVWRGLTLTANQSITLTFAVTVDEDANVGSFITNYNYRAVLTSTMGVEPSWGSPLNTMVRGAYDVNVPLIRK